MLWIAVALIVASLLAAVVRMVVGPDDTNRSVATDLMFFAVVALVALIGTIYSLAGAVDLVLVATLVGFLSAISLARALTRGKR